MNNKVIKNLKNAQPSLNSNDLRFISYIYMNLKVKIMLSIYNITFKACGKRNERIAVRLTLEISTCLNEYVSGL